MRAGERVLVAGAPIGPAEIAALASVGRTRAPVYRPPVVRIISTGDEVVELPPWPTPVCEVCGGPLRFYRSLRAKPMPEAPALGPPRQQDTTMAS